MLRARPGFYQTQVLPTENQTVALALLFLNGEIPAMLCLLSPHLSDGAREYTCSIFSVNKTMASLYVMGEGHYNLTPIYTWLIDLHLPDRPFSPGWSASC